jgi:hypothetical protein
MTTLLVVGGWLIFCIILAVIMRVLAVKYAERRGWSALTMPMSYHIWFITIYLVITQVLPAILYITLE